MDTFDLFLALALVGLGLFNIIMSGRLARDARRAGRSERVRAWAGDRRFYLGLGVMWLLLAVGTGLRA